LILDDFNILIDIRFLLDDILVLIGRFQLMLIFHFISQESEIIKILTSNGEEEEEKSSEGKAKWSWVNRQRLRYDSMEEYLKYSKVQFDDLR